MASQRKIVFLLSEICLFFLAKGAALIAQLVKKLPAVQDCPGSSLPQPSSSWGLNFRVDYGASLTYTLGAQNHQCGDRQ